MKRKKNSFIWVVALVILGGIVYVANASQQRAESGESKSDKTPQQQQQQAKVPPTPSAASLQEAAATQLKNSKRVQSQFLMPTPKQRPLIERPVIKVHQENQQSHVISTQPFGGWYHPDSVKGNPDK